MRYNFRSWHHLGRECEVETISKLLRFSNRFKTRLFSGPFCYRSTGGILPETRVSRKTGTNSFWNIPSFHFSCFPVEQTTFVFKRRRKSNAVSCILSNRFLRSVVLLLYSFLAYYRGLVPVDLPLPFLRWLVPLPRRRQESQFEPFSFRQPFSAT